MKGHGPFVLVAFVYRQSLSTALFRCSTGDWAKGTTAKPSQHVATPIQSLFSGNPLGYSTGRLEEATTNATLVEVLATDVAEIPSSPLEKESHAVDDSDDNDAALQQQHQQQQDDDKAAATMAEDRLLLFGLSPIVWLNGVAILWGSQHAVIKNTIMEDDGGGIGGGSIFTGGRGPADLLLLRFGLAAILALVPKLLMIMIPIQQVGPPPPPENGSAPATSAVRGTGAAAMPTSTNNSTNAAADTDTFFIFDSQVWRWGAEMGLYMFLGFLFQAIGLQYTTAQKSGFLLYLNVKLVPFFALLLYGRPISTLTFVSALAAFVGTTLLATDTGGSWGMAASSSSSSAAAASSSSWNIGDQWTIAAAAASAMFILRLEKASQARVSALDLNAASLVVVTALAALWSIAVSLQDDHDNAITAFSSLWTMASTHPWELLYLGGVTTAFSNWIQTRAQRYVPAERAALIYSLDPVYGAGFAYLLLGERLTSPAAVAGAALITVAAGTNAYLEFNKKDIVVVHPEEQMNGDQ
jgi:drug/metabolite transporter (DMT)-like permease